MWQDLKDFFRDRYNQKMVLLTLAVIALAALLAWLSSLIWPAG